MDVYEAVRSRRAIRGFTDEPVAVPVLERVLDAASWAPSGSNLQPWRSYVVTGAPLARLKKVAVARVAAGEQALLLIDEAPMHADPGPHWIVAHAAAGPYVVVEDPWVNQATGETWVDTHDLPIHIDDLERLVAWGPEGYRGVIFLSPR